MNFVRCWIVFVLFLATGCQTEKPAAVDSKGSKAESDSHVEVTLGLNWYPEAEHGGYYAALVHGFYREEGLNVSIRPGGPNVPLIAEVAANRISFGVDNADKLLLLRAQQADVVVVMSPIQNSPRCIMVHKASGLKKIEDIAGAKSFTLAMNQGQPFAQFLLKKLNLGEVQIVPFAGGIGHFLEQPNFGQQAYDFSEPFLAEKQGGDPQCLMLSDLGFNTYTSVLLTNRDMINKQSDVVARMTRASIRGWKKYLADPDPTNEHIHQQNSLMDKEILAFGAKTLKPACLPDGMDENHLGQMTDERWQTLITQMVEIGSIKPDTIKASDAYTLKFLESK